MTKIEFFKSIFGEWPVLLGKTVYLSHVKDLFLYCSSYFNKIKKDRLELICNNSNLSEKLLNLRNYFLYKFLIRNSLNSS